MALITLQSLTKFQWDKSNLWDVTIAGMNFHAFPTQSFASTTVELDFFGVTLESIGNTGLSMAYGSSWPTFNLTFVDDEELTTLSFFKDWIFGMATLDGYASQVLSVAKKTVTLTKHKHDLTNARTWTFDVIPSGAIQYQGESDGAIKQYTINFNVVGGDLEP